MVVFFFFCQVKFMKKGISQEMLADLCYCDTSIIYLVTSGRKREKRSLLSWRKYQWKRFVWASKGVGKQSGVIQVLHFSPCPVMSIAFDRLLRLRGISLAVPEVHLHRWSQIKTTGLSFVKNCLCFPLSSEVIMVTTDWTKECCVQCTPRTVRDKFLLHELAGVPEGASCVALFWTFLRSASLGLNYVKKFWLQTFSVKKKKKSLQLLIDECCVKDALLLILNHWISPVSVQVIMQSLGRIFYWHYLVRYPSKVTSKPK